MENNNLENLLEFPNEGIIEKNTTLKRVIILNKFNSINTRDKENILIIIQKLFLYFSEYILLFLLVC